MGQLHELTMREQAAAVRRREVSATELVGHYLQRIEAHNGDIGAFFTVTAEAALAQARAADSANPTEGAALYGVPVAIKDLTLTAGVRTTFGSPVFASYVPTVDAHVVRALRKAGTISVGKTATSEFGNALYCETAIAPPVRNPWRREYTAGGSSGGAAAAVAAGLVPAAEGSDGGGSVRIPAALCGLVGFKPSRGVVPGGPFGFGAFGLPTHGPLARTVADAAALLDAMAAPAPGEPYLPPPLPAGGYLAAALRPDPGRRLRIGCWTQPVLADVSPDPACLAAVDVVAAALADAGHEVEQVAPPLAPATAALFEEVWGVLALGMQVPPAREHELQPITAWLRDRGRQVSSARLQVVLSELQAAVRVGAQRHAGLDVLLSPTLANVGAEVGYFAAASDAAEDFGRQKRFSPYCACYNLTGAPAVSLPVGHHDGLPVAAMLAAAPGADALLWQVAAQIEQALPWADRHPPQWSGAGSATVNAAGGE